MPQQFLVMKQPNNWKNLMFYKEPNLRSLVLSSLQSPLVISIPAYSGLSLPIKVYSSYPLPQITLQAWHCLYIPESASSLYDGHQQWDYHQLQRRSRIYRFQS